MTNKNPETLNIALLYGGTSAEREISLASGEACAAALSSLGYAVSKIDTANKEDLLSLLTGNFDVAFLALHGKGGEDGLMQGFLETIKLPYTGPGVWASSTAMDKVKSKILYQQYGVRTPKSKRLTFGTTYNVQDLYEGFGPKLVVKPASEGSALGVYIVESQEDLEEALNKVFSFDKQALIEQFVAGRELTVAILGNDKPEALPVIEIIPKHSFYDFESKYAPGGSRHICPAEIDPLQAQEAQELAIAAHKALECRGVSRSDIILDTQGACWVLETNTIPGMTETSLLPDAARAIGLSFPELCKKLIDLALE